MIILLLNVLIDQTVQPYQQVEESCKHTDPIFHQNNFPPFRVGWWNRHQFLAEYFILGETPKSTAENTILHPIK